YAVRVDTSEGFELCPADVCTIEPGAVCPAVAPGEKFRIIEGFTHPLLTRMEAFLGANGVGAIEFITDRAGNTFAYDVNTNTNYNSEAEARAGQSGMGAIAQFLTGLLQQQQAKAA
ncbi:MAG: alpha-L-glutamate ligase, partial [Acetobacteraceae bacterium]